MSEQRPLQFALVGAGRIAQAYIEAFQRSDLLKLATVVEPREDAGKAVAEEANARWFASYDNPEVLEGVNGVILCTPPATHFEIANYFLEHGKPVLCEKPLTIRSEDSRALVSKAAETGLTLMMASKFRYVDDLIRAKSLIETGAIGTPVLLTNGFVARVDMRGRWNSDPEVAGGGVLIDNGSHSVDIARYLLGPLTEVQGRVGLPAQDLPVDESFFFDARTEGGAHCRFELSWNHWMDLPYYLGVYGTEGVLQVGWKGSRLKQNSSPDWMPFGKGYDKIAAFFGKRNNCSRAIQGLEEPLIRPEDALASVQVIEAIYKSAETKCWTKVDQ